MNAELFTQLSDLISKPVDMVELLSTGAPDYDAPNVISVDCHPGTPLVFTFAETRVVFHCKSGATVGVDIVATEFDPTQYFAEPMPDDEDYVIVQIPIFHFLEGPHGQSFHSGSQFVDSITFVHRKSDDGFDGIAAVVFAFHDSTMFGLSAVHESHFCYTFNNYCTQLLTESDASPAHSLHTIRRDASSPLTVDSVMWMVE